MTTTLHVPQPARAIRARRHPFAIGAVYVVELAFALLVATPVHAWALRVWGRHPEGDAVLWAPGARELTVWLFQDDPSLSIVARTVIVLGFVSIVAMQLPLGALLASLAFARGGAPDAPSSGRSLRMTGALRIALFAFMPLAGLLVLGAIFAALVLLVGSAASSAIEAGLVGRIGDARAFIARLCALAPFALLAALVGIVMDLARAAVVREVGLDLASGTSRPDWTTMLRGLRAALGVARRGLRSATLAWAWRFAGGLTLIGLGAAASEALGGKGGGALVLLWIAHQTVVLLRVALRASWLAHALTLVIPSEREAPSHAQTGDEEGAE